MKNNATISYAKDAIKVWDGINASRTGGGVIEVNNARFINNWRSVEFGKYMPIVNNVAYQNISGFNNCTFIVDSNYRAFSSSRAFEGFISLWEVNKIKITNCVFAHQTTGLAPLFASSANMGRGIHALGAGSVTGNNVFSGTRVGIELGNSGNVVASFQATNNVFRNVHTGIINNAHLSMVANKNTFNIGAYPINDLFNLPMQEGIVINAATKFTVQNNIFSIETHNNNTAYGKTGIRVLNTGFIDKSIYKNTFNGLNTSCQAIGRNGGSSSGLQYLCNEFNNSTNWDILVNTTNQISVSTIGLYQGKIDTASGNKFGSVMDIQYPANVTRLRYYYRQNNFIEFPDRTINVIATSTRANTCPDLTIVQLTAGTQMFNTAQQQYTQYKQQYNALLDDGKTAQLLDHVQKAKAQNANGAKQKVNRAAPYLSETVAKAFILNTAAFTGNDVKNVLLDNPELIHNESFKRFVEQQNRLNANQWATVIANSDTAISNRGFLESNLNGSHLSMQLAVDEITNYYLNAEDSIQYDSVAAWLLRKETLVSAYQLVELDWQQRNYSTAFNKLANIPLNYPLDSVEQLIYNDYFSLRNLIFIAQVQGRELNQLNTSEQTQLANIAVRREYYPNFQARSIENYFYGKNWTTKPEFPSMGVQMRPAQPTETQEQPQIVGEFDDWAIYPNPAKEQVMVNLPELETEGSLKIVNLSGQVVYSQMLNLNANQVQINVSDLANGLYILSVENGDTRWAKNLIIQR